MISPEELPNLNGLNLVQFQGAIDRAVKTCKSAAEAGRQAHAAWQGLRACYKAPEGEDLYAKMDPVKADAGKVDKVGSGLKSAGRNYIVVVQPLQTKLRTLRREAAELQARQRAGATEVEEEARIRREAKKVMAAFHEADEELRDKINGLNDGAGFHGVWGAAAGPGGVLPAGVGSKADRRDAGQDAAEQIKRAAVSNNELAMTVAMGYKDDVKDPVFAKAMIASLGVTGMVGLPALIAARAGVTAPERATTLGQARPLLGLVSTALATATTGTGAKPLLDSVKKAGRAEYRTPGGNTYRGYWGLGQILAAGDGKTKFSAEFGKIVGRDMIDWDRKIQATGDNKPSLRSGGDPREYDALTVRVGADGKEQLSDPMTGLMDALATNREAAQGAFDYAKGEGDDSNLRYLISERRQVWDDKGAALGRAIEAAGSGTDATAKKFSFHAIDILADEVRDSVSVGDGDGKLHITNPQDFDRLSAMREPLARMLGTHWNAVTDPFTTAGKLKPGAGDRADDLAYAFFDLGRDDAAFNQMVKAQTAHTAKAFGIPLDEDADDPTKRPEHVVVTESQMFGRLLAARALSLGTSVNNQFATEAALGNLIKDGIGLIPVPGSGKIGEAAGGLGKRLFETLASKGYGAAGDLLTDHLKTGDTDIPVGYKNLYADVTSNETALKSLINQQLAVNAAEHMTFPPEDLTKDGKLRIFADPDRPGRVLSPQNMKPEQRTAYLEWIIGKVPMQELEGRTQSEFDNGMGDVRNRYGLPNPQAQN